MKILIVENCMECPVIKDCKAWKELTPHNKFFMKTSAEAVKILPKCPLKEYEV
jgi:hypothetical protein